MDALQRIRQIESEITNAEIQYNASAIAFQSKLNKLISEKSSLVLMMAKIKAAQMTIDGQSAEQKAPQPQAKDGTNRIKFN